MDWTGTSVLSSGQFDVPKLEQLMTVAGNMKDLVQRRGGDERLKGKVLANVFFEPSTRTSCSFQSAMLRLGGSVMQVNESSSSAKKGETLEDTIRCLACYADVLVLRHPQKGSAALAASAIDLPVLNAGDGAGEHPTQALLDLYTILDERRRLAPEAAAGAGDNLSLSLRGLCVALVGDLKHGRTVHSLATLLALFDVTLLFVAPETLQMPDEVRERVSDVASGRGGTVAQEQHMGLSDEVLARADVLYVTRVQKERFSSADEYESVKDVFCVTPDVMTKARPSCALMHPLPRVGEISPLVDSDPRAAYFRQMRNGMYVRMALLALLLGAGEEEVTTSCSKDEDEGESPKQKKQRCE